jgi:magnesium transporter
MASTRLYSHGKLVQTGFPVSEISDHTGEEGATVWADFVSPTESDLEAIQEELGLHALAVEDAVHEHQRPKLDHYDSHKFLAVYDVAFVPDAATLVTAEIKAFITPTALITVHDESFDIDAVVARWDDTRELAEYGVSYLLWGLVDVVVDGQFVAAQAIDAATDDLEDALFADNPDDKAIERTSFQLRKALVALRRSVLPMRDVVMSIQRHEQTANDKAMTPYFQDVFDHVLRTTEWTETVRDLIATVLDTNVGLRGNRMNLIMKKVTSWAAIIAVPTAITGFFGQNLEFWGVGTEWGVWFSLALIAISGISLYVSFKKRDWL